MKLPAYQFLAQMSAALAVVVSLGFVAYELKQSRDLAVAELLQETYLARAQTNIYVLDVDAYNSAYYKEAVSGEELTWLEKKAFDRVMQYEIALIATEFHLWEMGLIRDGEWEEREAMIKFYMTPDHPYSEFWNAEEWDGYWNFRRRVQELWLEVNGGQPSSEQ
jgi:hypothetical protein